MEVLLGIIGVHTSAHSGIIKWLRKEGGDLMSELYIRECPLHEQIKEKSE
jgi:hypothetical protein